MEIGALVERRRALSTFLSSHLSQEAPKQLLFKGENLLPSARVMGRQPGI